MIVLLFLYYFFAISNPNGGLALPLSTPPLSDPPDLCTCPTLSVRSQDQDHSRSIWNIIWSCFTTIFACTWVSIPPNVPAPEDEKWRVAGRRLKLMLLTLLVPELVIYWALKQNRAAGAIAQRHIDKGWLETHAFFLIMGGLDLFDGDRRLGPLSIQKLEELHEAGKVKWPCITEEEINDRSKGDGLSKAIVILQTSWFVIQCIGRGVEHLPVTELEIVTLAYAALNGVTYYLWWNKPLDVRCPVPVYLKEEVENPGSEPNSIPLADIEEGPPESDTSLSGIPIEPNAVGNPGFPSSSPEAARLPDDLPQLAVETNISDPSSTALASQSNIANAPAPPQTTESSHSSRSRELQTSLRNKRLASILSNPHLIHIYNFLKGSVARFRAYVLKEQHTKGVLWGSVYVFVLRPIRLVTIYPVVVLIDECGAIMASSILEENSTRVPTFYAPEDHLKDSGGYPLLFTFTIVTAAVGGLHCIAWSFQFPSTEEQWIWRTIALIVTAAPIIITASAWISSHLEKLASFFAVVMPILGLGVITVPSYFIARILLLLLPLVELRALPDGAYTNLSWSDILPHV